MSENTIHEGGEKPESVIGHHTPGPWAFSGVSTTWLEGSDGTTVYHIDPDGSDVPSEADRALIAAAPDLLSALRATRAALLITHEPSPALVKASAAIAKATGTTP